MSDQDSSVRIIRRVAEVLSCFSPAEPVHSLTSMSKRLGFAKSTTHRLIAALLNEGFLMRSVHGPGYQLGYQMLHWGMVAQASLDLHTEAMPILRSLSAAADETAILSVRERTSGLCLEMVECSHPVRLMMQVGQRLSLHAGASSKVLIAFLPEAEIEQIVSVLDLPLLAPNTITDRRTLRDELAAIRRRGYATSFEETDRGAMGIAAPVYDVNGRPIAGIGLAAPLTRIPPAYVPAMAEFVLRASRQLSARLGAPGQHAEPKPGSIPHAAARSKPAPGQTGE